MQPALILLVTRDEDALTVFGTVLRHAGFAVRELNDPADALSVVEHELPALVITNYPTAVGEVTVTELLRGSQRTAHLPILNVTSHVLPFELARAEAAGVTVSVSMPVELAHLVAEVQRLLGTTSSDE